MVKNIFQALFGGDRNIIAETAGVFAVNKEKQAQRDSALGEASLSQFGKEFQSTQRIHWFDRLMDGLNRLPRPIMALGIIGLFIAAMIDPIWFSSRMVGIALIPEPMWWLLGAIVAFYFGGRHQSKVQSFNIDNQVAGVGAVIAGQKLINDYENAFEEDDDSVLVASMTEEEIEADLLQGPEDDNPVLNEFLNTTQLR